MLKKLPLAVVAGILTPKTLLPIFTLMSVVQSGATYTLNQAITSANTAISSANTINSSATTMADLTKAAASNVITSGVDFLKKWKTFCIEIISKINAIFLKVLFEILKKDLVNLIGSIVKDLAKEQSEKKLQVILTLTAILLEVAQMIGDYRRCKSLLDNILNILNLINGRGLNLIPLSLLFATKFLPGESAVGKLVNSIQEMQSLGMPTGALPDGTPNLMNLYALAVHKGAQKDKNINGKIEAIGVVPPVVGGLVQIFGKPM